MIQLTGAGKRYGPKILFENTDWLVTPNERTGIVGANGTGKSSMLKVLAGIEGLERVPVRDDRELEKVPHESVVESPRLDHLADQLVLVGERPALEILEAVVEILPP